ncbi:DUF6345 domain-containing protein [Mycolicibacterium hodleri]|uniref:Uncharacterized protein n=1 Tax=Mycolicibacterium hodleri TaxID=49897 RepID=A0A502DT36_9MYCO|nr:DUF6345 domain-containing protein [Mycolicibacterium hodleri]TPG28204.1 hypothetical protein EAH80_28225 [Mycolicibacterium hodleri]
MSDVLMDERATADVLKDKNIAGVGTVKPLAEPEVLRAAQEWLGGWYIVDHSACGNADLPATRGDTWGFVNGRAAWQEKNFVYGNGDVWADDFMSSSDHYAASNLPAGFDGVDSVVLGYIASHGVTSGSTFTMSSGGTGHGGCTVKSTQMSFGQNDLRYMFFSTCQSVRNVNPGAVWFRTAKGVRAIFGYHTNIVDSDAYGKYFFENWKKTGAKTTDSFLDASWRVSHDQSPVAAWFGPDMATAETSRDNEEYFQLDAISGRSIAWSWYDARTLDRGLQLSMAPIMTLQFGAPRGPEGAAELVAQLGSRQPVEIDETTLSGDNVCHRTRDGAVLIYNTRSGSIDLTFPAFSSPSIVDFSDDEAVTAATEYVRGREEAFRGLKVDVANTDVAVVASDVRHSMVASADESGNSTDPRVKHVTVVFRQTVDGIATIGTGGVIEVTLNGDREVCRVRSVLREVVSVARQDSAFDVAALQQRAEERALAEVLAQPYVNEGRVLKTEFGFFSADESIVQSTAEPSFRVLVEMQTGPFARIIEKIYPAQELAG